MMGEGSSAVGDGSTNGSIMSNRVMESFSKEELRQLYRDDAFCAAEIMHAIKVWKTASEPHSKAASGYMPIDGVLHTRRSKT